MSTDRALAVHNGHAFPLADCPVLPIEEFRQAVIDGVAAGGAALGAVCLSGGSRAALRLFAVLARADQGRSGRRLGRRGRAVSVAHARLPAGPSGSSARSPSSGTSGPSGIRG